MLLCKILKCYVNLFSKGYSVILNFWFFKLTMLSIFCGTEKNNLSKEESKLGIGIYSTFIY